MSCRLNRNSSTFTFRLAGAYSSHIPGTDGTLCVGPYAALRWWHGEREELDVDKGPHRDSQAVLQAPAEKELAWLRSYGRPRFPVERAYRETFDYRKQEPDEHIRSLKNYLSVAPYLVPADDKLNARVLRHPDLQPNNIFISEDCKITGLIDWQHALVLPTFLAAGMPNSFQNYNDEESMTFAPPRLPDDFGRMDEEEKAEAEESFRRRHVHFFYLGFTQRMNQPHWHALEQEFGLLKRRICDHAGSPWEGLNTPLQVALAQVVQNWPKLVTPGPDGATPSCPISFGEQEMQKWNQLDESLRDVDGQMERINRILDVASDGGTTHDLYEAAKEKASLIRDEGLESVSDDPWLRELTEKHWPFDDSNEDE